METKLQITFKYKYLLYFAIFVSPMGAQAFSIATEIGSISLFRASIFLAVIAVIVKSMRFRKDIAYYNARSKYSVLFMTIWLLYAMISIVWAKDFGNWAKYLFFIVCGWICIILCQNFLKTKADVINAFFALTLGIMIQAAIGWNEVISRNYRFISETNVDYYANYEKRIPIAMAGNPNDFALMMLIGFFTACICFVAYKNVLSKALLAFVGVNFILLLFLTTSRANIIALFMAAAFVIFFGGRKKSVALLFLCVAIALCIPSTVTIVSNQFNFNFSDAGSSDNIRINLIKNGFIFLRDTFGFGVGCGQIEIWMENNSVFYIGAIRNMHNWWMEILTSFGVGIFLGYIAFYIKLFKKNYFEYRRSNRSAEKMMAFFIMAIMVGFIIGSVSSSCNITSEYLWILWAIIIANQKIPISQEECESKKALTDIKQIERQ